MIEARLARAVPVLRIAVALGRDLRSMQMHHGTALSNPRFRPVERMIDRQEMPRRQLVHPLDQEPTPARTSNVGPGTLPPYSPQRRGGKITVQFRVTARMATRYSGNRIAGAPGRGSMARRLCDGGQRQADRRMRAEAVADRGSGLPARRPAPCGCSVRALGATTLRRGSRRGQCGSAR